MKEDGHNYTFGSPKKGWPKFGPDGRIVKEEEKDEQDDCE